MLVESEKTIVKSERLHSAKIAIVLFIVLLLGSLQLKYLYGKMADESVGNDFISYWSAAHLLLLGDNPYSPEKVFVLQKLMGRTKNYPLIMYNPPWTLTFILPFCLQNYYLSKLLWLVFNFGLVVFCAEMVLASLWRFV